MNKKMLLGLVVFVVLALSACAAGIDVEKACYQQNLNPGDTVKIDGAPYICPSQSTADEPATEEPAKVTEEPAEDTTDDKPAATEAPEATQTFEPSLAGGDFLAIAVDDLGKGWMRIRTAGNRDNCAWSNQFQMQLDGVEAQVPHCWEMRLTGSGKATFVFKPDDIGYDTSDTMGTGLAFWPAGNNGQYQVCRSGNCTEWIDLTTGPEGVNFPKNGNDVTINFRLNNGYVQMPLGEIRNNVLPRY